MHLKRRRQSLKWLNYLVIWASSSCAGNQYSFRGISAFTRRGGAFIPPVSLEHRLVFPPVIVLWLSYCSDSTMPRVWNWAWKPEKNRWLELWGCEIHPLIIHRSKNLKPRLCFRHLHACHSTTYKLKQEWESQASHYNPISELKSRMSLGRPELSVLECFTIC